MLKNFNINNKTRSTYPKLPNIIENYKNIYDNQKYHIIEEINYNLVNNNLKNNLKHNDIQNISNYYSQIIQNKIENTKQNIISNTEPIYLDIINKSFIHNTRQSNSNTRQNNRINNQQPNKNNIVKNKDNVILIIVDFIYMTNNLADSRYKYIKYLAEKNNNVILAGTGMKFFRQGMRINTLISILKIKPKLIIHANNFGRTKLLVSGLKDYPCRKALIVEDMHATSLITNLINYNRINYVFYHCDCSQLDRLKLLNRHIRFINYPHYIDTNIYKNYNEKKVYDIILYGCTNSSVYPFRNRLFNLIYSSKKFRVMYIPFPGYFVRNKNSIVHGTKLAKSINKSYIGIVTCSTQDYFLKKYLEVPSSYCMIAGNIPSRYRKIFKNNIIELTSNMSDAQILNTLSDVLRDKKKLLNSIDHLHNLIIDNFSYENGNESFNKIIQAIDKV